MRSLSNVLTSIRNRAHGLCRCERGNVAIIFALAFIPFVGAVGSAVDYSRKNSARVALQDAVDAAGLILSKSAASLTTAQLQSKSDALVRANFHRAEVKDLVITTAFSEISPGNYKLNLVATGTMETTIAAIFTPTMTVSSGAEVLWGMKRLELAMALDNTGSMSSSNKMTQLKLAAKDLLTTLQGAAKKPDDIKISIVPFATDVNVGTGNVNANWIKWDEPDGWEPEPEILQSSKPSSWYTTKDSSSCPFTKSAHGFVCVTAAQGSSNASNIPSSGYYSGLICPGTDGGNKYSEKSGTIYNGCYNTWTKCEGANCACTTTDTSICSCSGSGSARTCQAKKKNNVQQYEHTWRPTTLNAKYTPTLVLNNNDVPYATPARSTWNGCVFDRDQSNDVNNAATNVNLKATLYGAHQFKDCPVSMMALTNNWTSLNAKIDEMQPVGNTNVTIGLQMAFQTLSPVAPFNAAAPVKDLDKVIILLTDGENTQSRDSTTAKTIDARTKLACQNAKDANIRIYTIRVINGNADLLKACATKPDMYYDVQNASQLSGVFKTIAQSLANLRLAK